MMTNSDAPAEIAQTIIRAFEKGAWADVSALLDVAALDDFHRMHLEMAMAWEQAPRFTEHRDSELPEAVAKYYNEIHAQTMQHGNPTLSLFNGIGSIGELERLSPQESFTRYLRANELKPENYEDGRPPLSTRTVLGTVQEPPYWAHVVYRKHTDVGQYGETEETEVMSLRLRPDGWRAVINRDISSTGAGAVRIIRSGPPDTDH